MTSPNMGPGGDWEAPEYSLPWNTGETEPDGIAFNAAADEEHWREVGFRQPFRNSFNPALERIILLPLANLLAWILGGSPQDWDTLEEIQQNLVPALTRLPVRLFAELFTGNADGDENTILGWVSGVFGRDHSLASRVSALEGKIAQGAEFFDNFNRGDNASSLGNGWVQGGDGQGLGIYDQAAQLDRTLVPNDGRRWAKCPTDASNDDQTVAAVIHPRGTPAAACTSLFLRCNPTLTQGVYVNLFGEKCYMGRFTRSGNSWTFNDFPGGSNLSKSYSNSATVEFKATGNHYQLVVDSKVLIDYTDTANTAPIGAGWRSTGFAAQTWTIVLVSQYSGGLASYAMRSQVALTSVSQQATTAATAAATEAVAPVQQAAEKAQQTAQDTAQVAVTTGLVAGQTYARSVYTANGTWTKPTPPAGKRIVKHGVALINGGDGGNRPDRVDAGGRSRDDGGYTYKEFTDAEVPASVPVTIGAGGAGATSNNTAGSAGGVTSFGSLLSGRSGTSSIPSTSGALASTCRPGYGGEGGAVDGSSDASFWAKSGLPGGNSVLANGGYGGAKGGSAGAAGQAATDDPLIISGGGGGGGGGGATGNNNGGRGGDGGAPGGAGGSGGSTVPGTFSTNRSGDGGNGAPGKAAIYTYFEDIT